MKDPQVWQQEKREQRALAKERGPFSNRWRYEHPGWVLRPFDQSAAKKSDAVRRVTA